MTNQTRQFQFEQMGNHVVRATSPSGTQSFIGVVPSGSGTRLANLPQPKISTSNQPATGQSDSRSQP